MFTFRVRSSAARLIPLVLLGVLAIVTACSDSSDTRTLVLRQEEPELVAYTQDPIDSPTPAEGSLWVFDAAIATESGLTGRLVGNLITTDITEIGANEAFEDRIGTLVFILGDDQLVVGGGTTYPAAEREMRADLPQVRAVLGGTGAYLGASGQVTTVRNSDGTYTHTFELVD